MRAVALCLTLSGCSCGPAVVPSVLGDRLVLWLEADQGIKDGVWRDQSGSKNDARQIDMKRVPTMSTVNGHWHVSFASRQFLEIADAVSLQWGKGDFALYAVIEHTNPAPEWALAYGKWVDRSPDWSGPFIWANYPNTSVNPAFFVGYAGRVDEQHAAEARGAYNDGRLRLVSLRRTGSTLELGVNRTVHGTVNIDGFDSAAFDAVGRPALIGGRSDGLQQFKGGISELIGAKGTVSNDDHLKLEAHLTAKYGL